MRVGMFLCVSAAATSVSSSSSSSSSATTSSRPPAAARHLPLLLPEVEAKGAWRGQPQSASWAASAGNPQLAHFLAQAAEDGNRRQASEEAPPLLLTSGEGTSSDSKALQLQAEQHEQSFGDWWSEYWSRQPFPSGYTQSSITLLACLITTIMFLIVVGNLLVCIAIFTEKSLKPTQNWFIASLAVSDMLLGLVVMPFSLARELMGFWIFGPLWCDIHEAIDVLLTTASINTLCLISLDRYWSITQAVSYLKKRTPRRGAFMIAFVWILSAAVSLPPLFGWKKQSPSIIAPQTSNNNSSPTAPSSSSSSSSSSSASLAAKSLKPSAVSSTTPTYFEPDAATTSGVDWGELQPRDRRGRSPTDELATPLPASLPDSPSGAPHSRWLQEGAPQLSRAQAQQLLLQEELGAAGSVQTGASQAGMQTNAVNQATEYPSCQLSDDVGYVLYSALGSFYIPCAVMVFTYIKIFLAARSRARRAINKQARGQAVNKRMAARRAQTQSGALSGPGAGRSAAHAPASSEQAARQVLEEVKRPACAELEPMGPPVLKGGKIVIVERKKSIMPAAQNAPQSPTATPPNQAANAASAPKAAPVQQQRLANPKLVSPTTDWQLNADDPLANRATYACSELAAEQAAQKELSASSSSGARRLSELEPAPKGVETSASCATLITSCAKQASPSALNSSTSNDSSMITVMNASMSEVPITRFSFKAGSQLSAEQQTSAKQRNSASTKLSVAPDEDKAAALLKAISEPAADPKLLSELLALDEDARKITKQTEVAGNGADLLDNESPSAQMLASDNNAVQQATNETCFMTIEEDSDMFESQAGRTIMLVSNKQAKRLQAKSPASGFMVTMAPPGGAAASPQGSPTAQRSAGATPGGAPNCGALVCSHASCARQMQARSASSYCGSSLTINDDDLDECADEEPLTDDCNGYSVSCALDQYCQVGRAQSCAHCFECDQRSADFASPSHQHARHARNQSVCGSPVRAGGASQAEVARRRRQTEEQLSGEQRCASELEMGSLTGEADDNVSHMTEFRSNDDLSSSLAGHDVLDATEPSPTHRLPGRKKSLFMRQLERNGSPSSGRPQASGASSSFGERKRSLIGFRLTRLASNSPLNAQSSGLLALASSHQQHQQQQQQQQQAPAGGGARNLKALRQNFFLKLNQLTAKTNTTPKAEAKRTAKPMSTQSSGTDHEASLDGATTSALHSTEYPQETTGCEDDYEQHTSADSQLNTSSNKCQPQPQQRTGSRANELRQSELLKAEQALGSASRADSSAQAACQDASNDKALLLRKGAENNEPNKRLLAPNQLLVSSKSDSDFGDQVTKQQQQAQVRAKKSAPAHQLNHAHTLMSSSAGASNGTSVNTNRAYLASDNERHKRKLAKARERRATLILGLIMTCFICAWLPFFSFYVLRALCTACREFISPRFESFIFWMGYCNSAINPIIYTIFNRDFRKAFRKILFKCL